MPMVRCTMVSDAGSTSAMRSHCACAEIPEDYRAVLGDFLDRVDAAA